MSIEPIIISGLNIGPPTEEERGRLLGRVHALAMSYAAHSIAFLAIGDAAGAARLAASAAAVTATDPMIRTLCGTRFGYQMAASIVSNAEINWMWARMEPGGGDEADEAEGEE